MEVKYTGVIIDYSLYGQLDKLEYMNCTVSEALEAFRRHIPNAKILGYRTNVQDIIQGD